jgi:hypothetical protein
MSDRWRSCPQGTAHLSPLPSEAAAVGAPLTQLFSDELGWRDL